MTAETKTCTKCEITKPVGEFYSRNGKTGAQCQKCHDEYHRAYREANREKMAAYHRAYREANKEKIAEGDRTYYEANRAGILAQKRGYYAANKEKVADKDRAYYEANREKIREKNRAYREANREKMAAYHRAYHEANREERNAASRAYARANREELAAYFRDYAKANPEAGRASNARRRARMAAAEVDPTLTREALRERDGDGCHYCGVSLDFGRAPEYRPTAAHLDHVLPLSRGGSHTFDNAVLACARCNLSKGDKTPQEWEEMTAA